MQAPPANSDQGKQTGATGRLAHETEVGKSERQFIEAVRRSIDAVADRVGGKKELARLLGVAENTLHNWYNGTNTPKGEILNQLVVRFGVDPRFLLTGEGEPVPRAAPITMSPVLLDIAVRHLCESLKSLSAMSALLAPLMNGSARHELALQASGMAADLG
ncbi:MAG: helix-turn-helix transcriptional regulator, partial [Planctomycetota bacterium]